MADSNRRAPGLRAGIAALTGLAALSGGCGGLRGLDYGRGPCQGGEPRIAADSAALTWVENPDRAAHPVTTRDQTLALLATDQDMTAAPQLRLGTPVRVWVGADVGKTTIYETPMDADGNALWDGWQEVLPDAVGETVVFAAPVNLAPMLSSDSRTFEPGASIRGIVLTLSCGTATHQHGFAYRTGAAFE